MIISGDVGSWQVRSACRVFNAALRILPRRLLASFGAAMREDFARDAAAAYSAGGTMRTITTLTRAVMDIAARAPGERQYERRLDAAANVHSTYIPLGERMLRILSDVRVAARTLSRRPGFSFVVMMTLALGIGANIAIFAVVNAVLIRPLPYPASNDIVALEHHAPGLNLPDLENSPGSVLNYSKNAHSFTAVGVTDAAQRNLTGEGEPEQVMMAQATPSLFDVLRVQPSIGRRFVDEDTAAGAPKVVILTHGGWTRYFGARRDALGRSIMLNGVPHEIIGVMPKGFAYPSEKTMALLPMHIDYSEGYGAFGLEAIARLKPGVTLDAAQAEVNQLQKRIPDFDKDMGDAFLKQAGWSAGVVRLRDRVVKDAAKTLWIVLGTVGFLLIVACASVANLFLVRAEGRRREVGVRFALGASRGRVAATFLAESVILGIAGGAWGMLIAYVALRGLIAAAPPELPRLNEIAIDGRVLFFGIGISIIAGIVFGILPLPHRMKRPLADLVRGGRGQTEGRDRQTLRKGLIIAQIALALMLLVGSGLMLRSFQKLRSVDSGVRPKGVLTIGVSAGTVKDHAAAAALYQEILNRLAAVPGVTVSGASNSIPIDPKGLNGGSFDIRSAPRAEGKLPPVAMYTVVSGGWFKTLGTPLVEGRDIDENDVTHVRNVAVVNQTFARDFMKGKAIGQEINFGSSDTIWHTIVGVVKDQRTFGLREEIKPMAYFPLSAKMPSVELGQVYYALRTNGDPTALTPNVRAAIHAIAPNLPVTTARTMDEVVATSTAETSLTMTVLGLAAAVALLLGAIGLYGVIGYVVTQRTKEIGVRIALGAVPGSVSAMVLRQGMALAAAGTVIGLVGAATLSRLMKSILFEVNTRDPLTFAVVPIILLAVTAFAAYLPARRAASVSPMEALRNE